MSTISRQQNRSSRASRLVGAAMPEESPPTQTAIREQFIPLRKAELVDALAGSAGLTPDESQNFRRFCRLLEGLVHREFQTSLEELKNAYAPFDPDADTRVATAPSDDRIASLRALLFDKFRWLLERGNFCRLKQEEIDRALAGSSQWGLRLAVDFDLFERLELYSRGDTTTTRSRRRLMKRFRNEAIDVPIYQRLVVIYCLRKNAPLSRFLDTDDVHIKVFKDIPQLDLEMLLPGTQVKMSPFDRMRIMLPTLSGVSLAVWKLVTLAAAPLFSSIAFLGLVGGTVGYGARSLYGYLNTKQKYQLNLTQSLYYQNLDNNAGAIHRLLDEAEEQENREAMLGYFYLWKNAPATGWTSHELDEQIEAFLRPLVGRDVDFEVADALAKLERLGLVAVDSKTAIAPETNAEAHWRAVPIETALEGLACRWRELPG